MLWSHHDIPGVFFGDRMASAFPFFKVTWRPICRWSSVSCIDYRALRSSKGGFHGDTPRAGWFFMENHHILGWKPHGNQLFKAQLDISQPVKGNQWPIFYGSWRSSQNMFRWNISASCQPGGFQGRAVPRPVASPIKTSIYWHIPIPGRTRIIVLAINIYIIYI